MNLHASFSQNSYLSAKSRGDTATLFNLSKPGQSSLYIFIYCCSNKHDWVISRFFIFFSSILLVYSARQNLFMNTVNITECLQIICAYCFCWHFLFLHSVLGCFLKLLIYTISRIYVIYFYLNWKT